MSTWLSLPSKPSVTMVNKQLYERQVARWLINVIFRNGPIHQRSCQGKEEKKRTIPN